MLTIMGSQIRAARAITRLTLQGLADASGVSVATIIRAEKADGVPSMTRPNLLALRMALEQAGVVFLPDGGVRPKRADEAGTPA
jgi:transcriptional regulator with XRE-family HTH domain